MKGVADFMGVDILKPKSPLPEAYNLGFKKVDAEKLPFANKSFHVAVLAEIIEHVKDPVKVMREACRVADRTLITTPNEYAWDIQRGPFKNESHVRHYRTDTLEKDIVDSGLKILMFKLLNYDGWSFFTIVAM